jgi:hypothetical protein
MATSRSRPTGGGGQELAAVGCWGACWYGGCWGGCWPGVTAEPEVLETVSRSLADSVPEEMGNIFSALADTMAQRQR